MSCNWPLETRCRWRCLKIRLFSVLLVVGVECSKKKASGYSIPASRSLKRLSGKQSGRCGSSANAEYSEKVVEVLLRYINSCVRRLVAGCATCVKSGGIPQSEPNKRLLFSSQPG